MATFVDTTGSSTSITDVVEPTLDSNILLLEDGTELLAENGEYILIEDSTMLGGPTDLAGTSTSFVDTTGV